MAIESSFAERVCSKAAASHLDVNPASSIGLADLPRTLLALLHDALGGNANLACRLAVSSDGRSLSCDDVVVADARALQPLAAAELADVDGGRGFSPARVHALTQYVVARASLCAARLRDLCPIAELVQQDVRADGPGMREAARAVATVSARDGGSSCVAFEFSEDDGTLRATHRPGGSGGPPRPLPPLNADAYEDRFAGIVVAVYVYLCYVATLEEPPPDVSAALQTFLKGMRGGDDAKKNAKNKRTARVVCSEALWPTRSRCGSPGCPRSR